MSDLTLYLLSALVVALAALLLLPVVVAVRVKRTDNPGSIAVRLDGSVFAGLIGVSLHQSDGIRRLYPLWRRWTLGRGRILGSPVEAEVDTGAEPPGDRNGKSQKDADEEVKDKSIQESSDVVTSIQRLITLLERVRHMSRLLARPSLQLLRSLRHAASLKRLTLNGHIGLADPAATGSACALLLGVRGLNPRRVKIDLAPDFVTQRADGHVQLILHLYVGYALACIVRFGLRVGLGWLALRIRTIAGTRFQRQHQ